MRWFPLVAALFAALAVVITATPQPATAQTSPPASFYGRGAPLQSGDKVAVFVGGAMCGSTTVSGSLEWSVSVSASASCLPTEGASVSITVNGSAATVTPSPVWKVGGTPADVANGYTLVLGASPIATPPAANTASLISGLIPKIGGYGIIAVLRQAPIIDVVTATGCSPASMALYVTVDGGFLSYVPGTTIAAVNAAFLAQFPGGSIPSGTALIGKCA